MNKDVIYIEPEDDITDIIKKIKDSKEKIVALVPPRKTGVLRSIVNIKLIAKSASQTGKKVVLVTNDPAIMKLAAATKLPVTKNLQSAPAVPKLGDIEADEDMSVEEIIEKAEKDDGEEKTEEESKDTEEEDVKGEDDTEDAEDEEEPDDKEDNKKKSDKKGKKKDGAEGQGFKNPVIGWIVEHKKLCIAGGVGLVALILLLVWAFGIAPAVTVTVGVRTTKSNFSESVTFTEVLTEENSTEGKFFLEQKKSEHKSEVEFEATGQKNVGEKAKGELVIWAFLPITGGTANVSAGGIFSLGELAYAADADASISWDGDLTNLKDGCANGSNNESLTSNGCLIYGRIAVTAVAPGTSYNIVASNSGWKAPAGIGGAYSDEAMAGGTDKNITIVQQSDIDGALAKIKESDNGANKEKLYEEIPETSFAIDSSFKQTTGEAVSTPKVGEEVKEGAKAKLSVVTTSTVYYIDKTKVEEFITEKAKLAENYKVYNINEPFVENFVKGEAGFSGKLKASFVSGPKVTENDIVEVVKGKGIGTAKHDLTEINGIDKIGIDPSYPWVSSVPNDAEKITVFINLPSEQEE